MKRFLKCAAYIVILPTIMLGSSVRDLQAAPFDISITDLGYAPQVPHLEVGASVTWTNLQGVHTTTSRDGLWDSGVLVVGETFSHTFDSVGVFPYYDTIHHWPSGTINVVHSLARIDIRTDKTQYAAGHTMKIGLDLDNPGAAVQAGVFIWVKGPDSGPIWIVKEPNITLPAGFSYSSEEWKTFTLSALPRGVYSLHAALIKQPEQALLNKTSTSFSYGFATQSDWTGGPGYAWEQRMISFDIDLPWAAVADVDNNGKLEAFVTSEEYQGFPGEQFLRYELSQFGNSGELTGSILDGSTNPGWGIMTWDAGIPDGTTLLMEVRASNDAGNLGPYINVPSSGSDLSDLIDPDARYLQYRMNMTSSDPAVSPVVRDLSVIVGESLSPEALSPAALIPAAVSPAASLIDLPGLETATLPVEN